VIKLKQNDPQVFPQPYDSAFCDIYNCNAIAKWFIGTPEPVETWRLNLKVCDECLKKIIQSIPDELLPYDKCEDIATEQPEKAEEAEEQPEKAEEAEDIEEYKCGICDKQFDTENQLRAHCIRKNHFDKK
jgi:hypothetical protein